MKKKLSIIFSFYNEKETISYTLRKITNIVKKIKYINYEIIFVDDNSTDKSLLILKRLRKKDKNIKIIKMSRRFGHMEGIMAGVHHATGDALIYMDIDVQDPPELIPKMVYYCFKKNYDVVITTRTSRDGESFLKKIISTIGYFFLKKTTYIDIQENSGDFRLINRKVIDYYKNFKEINPFYRFIVDWIGFKKKQLFYKRKPRKYGLTKFPIGTKIIRQFFEISLLPFSDWLLRAIFFVGIIAFSTSIVIGSIILTKYFLGMNIPGWTAIMMAVLFFGATSSISLGILALYISSIFKEVKNRPLYIIDKKIGFN